MPSPSAPQPPDRNQAIYPFTEQLLTEAQVAERQQRSVKTLQNQRRSIEGIPFLRLGGSVRYRLSDVLDWEGKNRRVSTRQAAPTSPVTPLF